MESEKSIHGHLRYSTYVLHKSLNNVYSLDYVCISSQILRFRIVLEHFNRLEQARIHKISHTVNTQPWAEGANSVSCNNCTKALIVLTRENYVELVN